MDSKQTESDTSVLPQVSSENKSATSASNSTDAAIQANRVAAQQKFQKIIKVGALVIAALLLVYLISQWINSSSGNPLMDSEPTGISSVSSDNAESEVGSTLSQSELSALRNELIGSIDSLQTAISGVLANQEYRNWNPQGIASIELQRDKVLALFAKGAFASASAELQQLETTISSFEQSFNNQYTQYLKSSQAAFDSGDIQNARLEFGKAFTLSPSQASSESLKTRLDNYDGVAGIRNQLAVARTENDLNRQVDMLRQLIALNEATEAEQQEMSKLTETIVLRDLEKILIQGQQALNSGNLAQVESLLAEARQIDASNSGVSVLADKLASAKREQERLNIAAELQTLVVEDKWNDVRQLASTASRRFPQEAGFVTLVNTANSVLDAKQTVQSLLADTARLADSGVREYATQELRGALPLAVNSESLTGLLFQLDTELRKYQTKVDVTINSDGESFISVIGVGRVGTNQSKVISLTPGSYTLEASRKGFKTKRMDIEVTLSDSNTFSIAATEEL